VVDIELSFTSATEIARRIAAGELSPAEVTANAIARIEAVNPSLNAFCAIYADEALDEADQRTRDLAAGRIRGPLHGVPVAIKDGTPTKGRRTTLGSHAYENWIPDYDAAIVTALRRAGAIVVGKTTLPEFAHSSFTESPLLGITRNPWNLGHTPGGSSGGAGAAVASGCVPLAEGTDMGGSVRIPAAWCGLVGLKPSLGRIPQDILPSTFDNLAHHGPLARTVDDARLFLRATQGPDDRDIQSIGTPLDLAGPAAGDIEGKRFALSIDLGGWWVDAEVEQKVRGTAEALAAAGAIVADVELPSLASYDDDWTVLWAVYMAAYYGEHLEELGDRMDPAVVKLIEHGRQVSAVDYKRLEIARTQLWRIISGVLAEHDGLLCPTMAVPAPKVGKQNPRPTPPDDGLCHAHDMTAVFNLVAPCPVVSVPAGFTRSGLPVGMQIVGRRWRDDDVLDTARAVELERPWTDHRPPLDGPNEA
jgi:Asp-tRNA(Asn)/Glu-tRNA(Gln) amidotransferase A subunit family amidase